MAQNEHDRFRIGGGSSVSLARSAVGITRSGQSVKLPWSCSESDAGAAQGAQFASSFRAWVGLARHSPQRFVSAKDLEAETGLAESRIRMILMNPVYNGWVQRGRRGNAIRLPAPWRANPRCRTSCGRRSRTCVAPRHGEADQKAVGPGRSLPWPARVRLRTAPAKRRNVLGPAAPQAPPRPL